MTVPSLQHALYPPMPDHEHGGEVTMLSLRGDLDVLDAPALHAWLRGIRWQERPRSIVDLSGLAFIDCACLGVLMWHAREIRAQGGTLALAGPQGIVLRILSVTGLLTWFEVQDTIHEAAADGTGYQPLTFPATPAQAIAQSGRALVRADVRGATRPAAGRPVLPGMDLTAQAPASWLGRTSRPCTSGSETPTPRPGRLARPDLRSCRGGRVMTKADY